MQSPSLKLPLFCISMFLSMFAVGRVDQSHGQDAFPIFRNGPVNVVVQERFRTTDNVTVLPQDEIWFVNARDIYCPADSLDNLHVRKFHGGCWSSACLNDLVLAHSLNKTLGTVFFVHGNWTDESWAKSRGLQVYDNAYVPTGKSGCRPPVRFVIMAWRSEKESVRFCKDYLRKSTRSVAVGQTLAQILGRFEDRRIVLSGFSLGAQVIVSAVNHPMIESDHSANKGQFRILLIAPALDGFFTRNQLHRYPSKHTVAKADVFTNSIDRALRISRLARRKQSRTGNVTITQLNQRGNLPFQCACIVDVAGEIGRKHAVVEYSNSQRIRNSFNTMLLESLAAEFELTTIQQN